MRPPRPTPGSRRAAAAALAALLALGAPATASGSGPAGEPGRHRPCVASRLPDRGPARDVLRIAEQAKADLGLKSVILRVTVDGREVVTTALGESMTGVPATPAMHFRNGNIAIAYMGTALLRLVDQGRVRLDDPVGRWLPDLEDGDRITLRMLAASTTGLVDYVRLPAFQRAVVADPFRQWTAEEVVRLSTSQDRWYEPGTNWSYSHANFVLLGAALEKITGTRLDVLLQRQVLGPLGLRETSNSFTPEIPEPVLHAFTSDRGTYEESTFWNPSWTTAPGAVITTHICDLATSARAIGSGELLSYRSYRTLLNPGTVGLGGGTARCPASICLKQTEAKHFGLGVIVVNGWVLQNPSFSGYAAIQAYLPSKGLAIAVSATKTPTTPAGNMAEVVAQRIAAALAPNDPLAIT